MFARFAATTALGAALALAINLTTAAAPAFADGPIFEQITPPSGVTLLETAPRPNRPRPQPQPAEEPMFKPDVRVNYLSKTSSGGNVSYTFRVQNIGIGTAENVGLGNKIYQKSQNGSLATLQSGSSGTIASLVTDESKEITVTCTPLAGYRCDGASLEAYLQGDLNPANNKANGD